MSPTQHKEISFLHCKAAVRASAIWYHCYMGRSVTEMGKSLGKTPISDQHCDSSILYSLCECLKVQQTSFSQETRCDLWGLTNTFVSPLVLTSGPVLSAISKIRMILSCVIKGAPFLKFPSTQQQVTCSSVYLYTLRKMHEDDDLSSFCSVY